MPNCLPSTVIPSNKEFGAVVQLDVFRLFKQYFMSICPGAEVISELDYKGYATTIFAKPLGTASSNPYINAIFELLQDDYRGENRFSFRKNDALGICPSNGRLQLIEVTTADNVLSANRPSEEFARGFGGLRRFPFPKAN